MVGPLGAQDGPLRYLTTPLVTKTIGDGVVGYREAVRGTAAGKSLARMQIIVALSGASLTNCPDLPITGSTPPSVVNGLAVLRSGEFAT